jgi:aminoglycoside phosphotransferase (APT) family kinase protein
MTISHEPTGERPTTSTRDYELLRSQLEAWVAAKAPGAVVSELVVPASNGMSSETVLFDLTVPGEPEPRQLVARIAPDPGADPVFRVYDMERQFKAMQLAAEHTDVPVPRVLWLETGTDAIGVPFFVMERIEGIVPPDVMPYTFGDNWLYDATPDQQRSVQTATVRAIAALHDIDDPEKRFGYLERQAPGDTHLRRHVANTRAWYDMVAREGAPSPLVERGFDWLEANWPAHESPTVLSWGDSRIGNVLYDDFVPVALLDWEMAGLGPAELDVGWIVYAHHVFQTLAAMLELPGMPEFMRPADVAAQYETLRGHAVRDLRFFMVYAALQWGIVFLRTGHRQAHFGHCEMPGDPEELIHNRSHLESLLADVDGI